MTQFTFLLARDLTQAHFSPRLEKCPKEEENKENPLHTHNFLMFSGPLLMWKTEAREAVWGVHS